MKTWKREVGALLLVTLAILMLLGESELLSIVVWPFTTFAGAAFGADWWSKRQQTKDE